MLRMSQLPLSAESILYPPEARSDTSRKLFKQKILKDRPEVLFADHYKSGDVSNLIFFTQLPSAWHSSICSHYQPVKREGICNGWKIKIKDQEDPDSVTITVNIYKNGTVMVQGDLRQFEKDFQTMKEKAQKENTTLSEAIQEDNTDTSSSSCTTSKAPERESEPPCSEQVETHHTMTLMKEQFTQLEIELVHLREQVDRWQLENHTPQMLSSEPRELNNLQAQLRSAHQERDHLRSKLDHLTEEVRELQRERENNKAELSLLTERLQRREGEVDNLQEQLRLHLTLCTQPPEEATASPPQRTSPPPSPVPETQPSLDHAQPASPAPGPTQPDSPSPPSRPEIVLLMDSNGKFIEEKRLFPNHRVQKIWCPTTARAMELLNEDQLGSPSHIIIHTGTNDLRTQQERVTLSLRRVIEKASRNFSNSRIVVSTLLQRKDFHPATIQRINAGLSQDCALRPNVHLAHHPSLDLDHLYDHVHLYKQAVPIFAKTLKDATLNRGPAPPLIKQQRTLPSPRPPRHPTRPAAGTPRPGPPYAQPQHHRPHHLSTGPPPLLRPEASPPPNEPRPGRQSYAQTVRGAANPPPPPTGQLNDIQHMLSLLCSHLMNT